MKKPIAKMTLDELKPDNVAVKQASMLINVECPKLLAYSVVLIKSLADNQVDKINGVDANTVVNTAKKISDDTIMMQTKLKALQDEFNQTKLKSLTQEDLFMACILLSQQATDWQVTYEQTVYAAIKDLYDYINIYLDDDNKLYLGEAPSQVATQGETP